MIRDAVQATLTVLESALHHAGPQLKSVVLASSTLAVASADKPADYVFSEADWNTFAPAQVAKLGVATPGNVTYSAGKVAAERAFWQFRDEHKALPFALTAVCPA